MNYDNFPPIDPKRETFKEAIELVTKPPTIFEIGLSRKDDLGDGNSINVWCWLLDQCGGCYTGCDVNRAAIDYSSKACDKWKISEKENVTMAFYCMDAVSTLRGYSGPPIDLLYLDGWDWDMPRDPDSVLFHVACMYEALPHMAPEGLVLVDDTINPETYQGKGEIAIPYLLGLGWKVVSKGFQYLLRKG